ncbi:hypothetical protein ACWCRD_16185 [Streptomyces sp. NPDC002092]
MVAAVEGVRTGARRAWVLSGPPTAGPPEQVRVDPRVRLAGKEHTILRTQPLARSAARHRQLARALPDERVDQLYGHPGHAGPSDQHVAPSSMPDTASSASAQHG